MYYITKFGRPHKAFKTLARAWIECFDRGFVVQRGKHRPGSPIRFKYRLDYGIHIIDSKSLPFKSAPTFRQARGSRKTKYKTENWIDHL